MIHIVFEPEMIQDSETFRDSEGHNWSAKEWWQSWITRAAVETESVIQNVARGKEPEFRDQVWKDLKGFLLANVFHDKCAYCESYISDVSYGVADHYRPKGRVTYKENGVLKVVTDGATPHPGYYWLAYDWRNLLPACARCNSAAGKMDQFPIAGEYVFEPREQSDPLSLDRIEQPLLLHPYYNDAIEEHIKFGDFGEVGATDDSPKGVNSIEVYNLRREPLRTRRYESQREAFRLILQDLGAGKTLKEALANYRGGRKQHSAAVLAYAELRLVGLAREISPKSIR